MVHGPTALRKQEDEAIKAAAMERANSAAMARYGTRLAAGGTAG